ncbi:PREDICTED: protein Spindly [Nicrophorus vespilloides]|uniref:Protein Spindly n=1 Tax=Nicrophorus vespilloides TaxID=110193 RepID=A0ABM1M5J7_NICVS|nr:PREDICTED: protein Spindly [Nicrophorus vespilloides]
MQEDNLDGEKYGEQYVARLKNRFEQLLEQNNQKIHELQRELSRATAVERDYIQEIEILQNADKTECKKLLERIQGLEETCHALRENRKEDLAMLEAEFNTKCEENRLLIEKTENLQRLADNGNVTEETEKVIAENGILRDRIEFLEKNAANLRETLEELHSQNNYMELELKSKIEEVADLNENYAVKSQELRSTNEIVETLQEEMAVMKSELDLLKNKSVDHVVQGNSLFAEVNDRRVQLQQNMTIMKEHYVEMKRERANLLNQINTLQKDNLVLAHRMEQDVVEMEKLYCLEVGITKLRIKTLEELIEQYKEKVDKKQVELAKITTAQQMDDFFNGIVKSKDEEIESLMKKLDIESMSQMTLFNNLKTCKRELGTSKLAVQQSLNENTKLRTEMDLMRLNDPELRKPCQECAKRKYRFALPQAKLSSSRQKEQPEIKQNKVYLNTFLKNTKNKEAELIKRDDDSPPNVKHIAVQNEAELDVSASVTKNSDIDATVEPENKENDLPSNERGHGAVRKGVRFTDDTVDPKTDKKFYRPRGKILTCPVTYITCKKKE